MSALANVPLLLQLVFSSQLETMSEVGSVGLNVVWRICTCRSLGVFGLRVWRHSGPNVVCD